MKIEYVREQLARGITYPDLFPHWYFGSQILRYYAPLPYLLVIWIANLSGLPLITALQGLIALCAWVGALLWLCPTADGLASCQRRWAACCF